MTVHDDRAAEVLGLALGYRGQFALAALAAAGLAVVEVGTVPPWMEQVEWEYEDVGPGLVRTPPDDVTDAYVPRGDVQ